MDPRAIKMLQRMGVKFKEIKAKKVIIEGEEEDIIIENPQVVETRISGQISYQIIGNPRKVPKISEEDVEIVAEKAGVDKETARKALEEAGGDIVAAIKKLRSL